MSIIIEFISDFLLNMNRVIGDWGISIILMTLIIRLLMIPLSIKQKKSMESQQQMSKEIEQLKTKYKNNKKKLEEEMSKVSAKYTSSMFGCLLTLVQMPVMFSLYRSISSIPMEVTTTIVLPWISNIKAPDSYFLLPIISVIIQLLPNAFYFINSFKSLGIPKPKMTMIAMTVLINLLIVSKVPAIVGVYWIASGIYTFVEQLMMNVYKVKKKEALEV